MSPLRSTLSDWEVVRQIGSRPKLDVAPLADKRAATEWIRIALKADLDRPFKPKGVRHG